MYKRILFLFGFLSFNLVGMVYASDVSYYDEVMRGVGCGHHLTLSVLHQLPPSYCHKKQLISEETFSGKLKTSCEGKDCFLKKTLFN